VGKVVRVTGIEDLLATANQRNRWDNLQEASQGAYHTSGRLIVID